MVEHPTDRLLLNNGIDIGGSREALKETYRLSNSILSRSIMKIVICGSSALCKEMLKYRDSLNKMGHQAIIHPEYGNYATKGIPEQVKKEHHIVKRQYGYIKWYYNAIVDSDAILVLNLDKNGVKNYIGGNTLMEMGFAHVHDKKVFLLNPPPDISYKDEILAMTDKVLSGDLKKIS